MLSLFIAGTASTLVILAGVLARRQTVALAGVALLSATAFGCVLTRSFDVLTCLLAMGGVVELMALARVASGLVEPQPEKTQRKQSHRFLGLANGSWST